MKVNLFIVLFSILFANSLRADKNVFTTFGSPSIPNENLDFFIGDDKEDEKKNNCKTQFDPNHPQSFEPNKTFLTFYGDSLGDLINEFAYGYFSWDQYLTLMYPAVEWNVQNLAHSGDTNEGIPMPFLVMAREKAVAIRQKVNEELIRRGVNHL